MTDVTPESHVGNLSVPAPPPNPEDFDKYIEHNTYRNVIYVHDTELIQHFVKAGNYMQDIHRKALEQVSSALRGYKVAQSVSRTTHSQIAAIVNRYMENIKINNPELHETLLPALEQAKHIEARAKQLADAVEKEKSKGNIRFVKSLHKRQPAQAN